MADYASVVSHVLNAWKNNLHHTLWREVLALVNFEVKLMMMVGS